MTMAIDYVESVHSGGTVTMEGSARSVTTVRARAGNACRRS